MEVGGCIMSNSGKAIRRVDSLQREIENAFSELIHTRWAASTSWQPAIDFYETEEAYLVMADLPGMDPSQVKFEADEKSVTICGIRQSMISITKGRNLLSERATGRFCRTIRLPGPCDVDNAQVQFKNGVFEVVLPKRK